MSLPDMFRRNPSDKILLKCSQGKRNFTASFLYQLVFSHLFRQLEKSRTHQLESIRDSIDIQIIKMTNESVLMCIHMLAPIALQIGKRDNKIRFDRTHLVCMTLRFNVYIYIYHYTPYTPYYQYCLQHVFVPVGNTMWQK